MNKSASEGSVGHSIIYQGTLEDYHSPVYLKMHKRTLVRPVHQADVQLAHLFSPSLEKKHGSRHPRTREFLEVQHTRGQLLTPIRERMEVWKHRGEEEILAGLLPTPLSRAILQGTKQFGVGKFFPRESLKAVNEFPTIVVVWVVPRETHILPAEPWVPKRDLYDKWDKGKREKQIRFPRIKGIDSADCFRTLAESQPHKPLGVSLLSIFTHGLKVHKTPHTKPQLASALSPDPCKKELPGAEARAGPVIIVLPAKS